MAQVTLKDTEIKQLKEKNNLIEQEKKSLLDEIEKNKNKLKGQKQLQVARHYLLWDQIAEEITKLWNDLSFIEDQRSLVSTSLIRNELENDLMECRLINRAKNTIIFLTNATTRNLHTWGVKDRLFIIMWAKKYIHKHALMNKIKTQEDKMKIEVENFQKGFKDLSEKGLPSLWDIDGKLLKKR